MENSIKNCYPNIKSNKQVPAMNDRRTGAGLVDASPDAPDKLDEGLGRGWNSVVRPHRVVELAHLARFPGNLWVLWFFIYVCFDFYMKYKLQNFRYTE